MEYKSILDRGLSTPPRPNSARDSHAAAMAAAPARVLPGANGSSALTGLPEFSGPDEGRSLGEMAERDLDAALQLLVERAQYITGATGAAIALRRTDENEMLCRASAGMNAPALGALLSAESGLSGESVRTRQALRCDDTETDPRVNRESCRDLGVASVVVMPIVRDDNVLGVFELFSGKAKAFSERDLSALQRLGEMVGTAAKHAEAAQALLPDLDPAGPEFLADPSHGEAGLAAPSDPESLPAVPDSVTDLFKKRENVRAEQAKTDDAALAAMSTVMQNAPLVPQQKKNLRWSAAEPAVSETAPKTVPPVSTTASGPSLRAPATLRKCQTCGFPVSGGRTLCVDCEEKQWRGGPVAPKAPASTLPAQAPVAAISVPAAPAVSVSPNTVFTPPQAALDAKSKPEAIFPQRATGAENESTPESGLGLAPPANEVALFGSGAAPADSWLASNKYVIGALVVVAMVIAAFVWLH
jgi:hypothetical protein